MRLDLIIPTKIGIIQVAVPQIGPATPCVRIDTGCQNQKSIRTRAAQFTPFTCRKQHEGSKNMCSRSGVVDPPSNEVSTALQFVSLNLPLSTSIRTPPWRSSTWSSDLIHDKPFHHLVFRFLYLSSIPYSILRLFADPLIMHVLYIFAPTSNGRIASIFSLRRFTRLLPPAR